MLRFRDWLRAHDADRELYEQSKRVLAGREWNYVQNYADAKSAVVEEIIARARRLTRTSATSRRQRPECRSARARRPVLRTLRSMEEPGVEDRRVSWLVIEPGWSVFASDGSEVGHVEQTVGDSGEDIFNGLSISLSFFDEPRYVPAEKIGRIVEDRVELLLTRDQIGSLEEFLEPPPSLDIDAEKASWSDRVIEGVTDIEPRPDDVPRWKRVRPWLASLLRR